MAAVVPACLLEGDGFRFLHTTPSAFTGNPFDPIEHSGSERSDPTAAARDRDSAFEKSSEYVGSYRSDDRSFTISEEAGHLSLASAGTTARLEPIWGDQFLVSHPSFDHAMLSFRRSEKGTVVEAFQLGEWYRNEAYEGPESYDHPIEWDTYAGHYRAFGVLMGSLKFFIRKGLLFCQSFGGYADSPLTDLGGGTIRVGDETSPHRMTFDCIADGKALRCRASDGDFYRVE